MENTNCILKLNDLYFSEISFYNKRMSEMGELNFDFKIDTDKDGLNFEKRITLTMVSKDDSINIKIVTVGKFSVDKEENEIIKYNTIAIMMPFIRSEVSLITAQPGIQPIVLPAFNVVNLIDQLEKNKSHKN